MKNRRGLPSDEYWRKRAEDRLDEAERLSVPYLEDIHAVYDDARIKIVEDIKNLYKNYYKDNEGFNQEKLRVIIPNGDLERFHREMRKAGLSEYLTDSYKARMTRLEYLYASCWAESKKASLKHLQIETKSHRETIKNAYYKTIYDTGVGLKINPAFSKLDNRVVNQVLNTKFLSGNYSERIWKNTDKLANTLKEVIGSAIARGESYSKTARGIRKRFNVTQYEATRLVQTETCYFQNQAEIEALKEMGIKKYKFIATLDLRTSDICREHDKKVYNVEDAKAGENLPPLHPNCRSTISAYLGEEYESAIRIARNENGVSEYVENVPYNEWLKRNAINISNTPTPRQAKGIQDGLSLYSPNLLEEYSSILPEKAPDDIFEKIEPNQGVNQHEYILTRAEIDFFNRLDSLNINYKLIEATWEARNDFVMFGRNWELKTPIAENDSTIKYLFWRITDQGKRNAVLDVTYFNKDLPWIFNKIKEHLETIRKGEYDKNGKLITNNDLIDSVLVVRGKKIIRYK